MSNIKRKIKIIIPRLIIYFVIWVGCYHICNVWLDANGGWDYFHATMWTGNLFWSDSFTKWFTNSNLK